MRKILDWLLDRPSLLAWLALASSVAYLAAVADRQGDRLNISNHNQLQDSVANVQAWCTAVDANRDEARALYKHLGITFVLHDINCAKLEQQIEKLGHLPRGLK